MSTTAAAATATAAAAKKFTLQIPTQTGASIRAAAQRATEGRHAVGVVVSAGRMQRTVQVQSTRQRRDTFLRRNYAERPLHMVADPADSLRAGDVVRIAPWRTAGGARRVSHVVTEIVRAFGEPVEARPPIIPLQNLLDARHAKWEAKHARRAERQVLRQGGDTTNPDAPHQQTPSEQSIAARKLDGLADDASRLEARAQELESRAERDGVDLEQRAGQMPKS